MIIDCHVHISACTPGRGGMSPKLLRSVPFRFMRWHFGLRGEDRHTEQHLESILLATIDQTPLDAAVVLAFDAVYDDHGHLDQNNTHLHITNDYIIELSQRHRKVLFGASIHPYRPDALAELERCVKAGAVLLKWLPPTQNMNPADPRCIPFYEALANYNLPLLCHTGGESSLPCLDASLANPMQLEEALRRGVHVILAHCGARSLPGKLDYLREFLHLARQYEHCYGDTAAMNLPSHWYAYRQILACPIVREKLLHGSDWPLPPFPPVSHLGWGTTWDLLAEENWMLRDILIKKRLGFDDAYWHRAAKILRLNHANHKESA